MATPESLTRTLTAWSAVSILGGGALWASDRTGGVGRFGRQTVAWGLVNGAIAAYGRTKTDHDIVRLRRILMVNAVADVGYLAAGVWLSGKDKYRADGAAVLVQGGFLLALDSHYAYHLKP
jgi:hypothetical protein